MKNKQMQQEENIANKGEIIIYRTKDGKTELEVKLKQETIWLTQKQIAKLFRSERSVITKHLRNIFFSNELDEDSVCAIFAHTASDGKTYQTKFYNLDVIVSVGYRVNSKQATLFRVWATKVLKDYLIKGYALNQNRLVEQIDRFNELKRAISFIKEKSTCAELDNQAREFINIINDYTKSLTFLYQYDKGMLKISKGRKARFVLKYDDCKNLIEEAKNILCEKGEAAQLFGEEVGGKFKSIIGALYQTFDKKELYTSIEEKAANLLYLTIKDHPFADGNKRIASLVFVYFLDKNNYLWKSNSERKISDNTIVALALLIANSEPKEKEVMIKIITNLLKE